ncbi:succinate dehydrogenase / fumarate reductase iron-sulfur subunit [Terrimicrobium sacchariphilum]|uniref:Succinate dehydrogenase / fumarate reductase iron-sulfur subunit n=1 Tax=Terrimicrobium sacchariphilum TaxID=690879 RepID=A0A146GE53_TERSA|nr:succinate dehydrogenase/fumarate reductase iron-sulfur subunit [Terrimicrobium sacchariphilum]GAT35403.1 succinate dehydrogenase / fumarate reductase iron-sulfur subunit [Terrimicrobium sacchariphilum]
MNFTLRVWRQDGPTTSGRFEEYPAKNIPDEASFLEMLDIVNEELEKAGKESVQFDHDCREGICGMCSLTINGVPHGPGRGTTCQLYMRKFQDGDVITIEPFRVGAFPILRDLAVNRTALDKVIQAGGFITARTGSAPDANSVPIPKVIADESMDAAACIGCGACAAACPNSSAMLFVSAKAAHLGLLPQGKPESERRTVRMVRTMDDLGFGNCSNYYACEAVCPAGISASFIARLNRQYTSAAAREAVGATTI